MDGEQNNCSERLEASLAPENQAPRPMNLGLFGTFYPYHYYAGNSSTGIAAVASKLDEIRSVTIFCTPGSRVPEGIDSSRAKVVVCWQHDNPLSLSAAMLALLVEGRHCDAFLFNFAITSFGRSRLMNGLGVLLPVAVRALTGKPVAVYLHNLVETQDYRNLGYQPHKITIALASEIERVLLAGTQVFVPLESQRRRIRERLGRDVLVRPLPYVEAYWDLNRDLLVNSPKRSDQPHQIRILLFGEWGPQKDLETPLKAFQIALEKGLDGELWVGGSVSLHFPEWGPKLEQVLSKHKTGRTHWIGSVPEEKVGQLFQSVDLVVLPYNASGGYSGAMNWAAACGVPVVAYDLPQLREFNEIIGAGALFVPVGSLVDLVNVFLSTKPRALQSSQSDVERLPGRLGTTVGAVRSLVARIRAG
jgi:glycosyltransferase involved in cell wall biosynthesis